MGTGDALRPSQLADGLEALEVVDGFWILTTVGDLAIRRREHE